MKTNFYKTCRILFILALLGYASQLKSQTVTPWVTTADKSKLLSQQSTVSFSSGTGGQITVHTDWTYQTVDGVGYFLSEGSAQDIAYMSSSSQSTLLNDIFGSGGLGVSAIRIPIGASDLSPSDYSYQDGTSFSLSGPDLTYLIPMIKQILAINPNIKILATPWSAPKKWKTNGSWIGGGLNGGNYGDYATYFLNYLKAMTAQGINIWAITPQNEPLNTTNEPSMSLDQPSELSFINNNLGPTLKNGGYGSVKIICYDHNCDNTAYPIAVANGSSYVDGSAFHLYAGSITAMGTVHSQTNKNVYFTEQYTGNGGSFGGDLAWHMQNVVIGSFDNYSKAVFEFNLASDGNLQPHTPGGCTSCLGAVTINSTSTWTKNVSYYIMGHVSKVVKAGAVRVTSNMSNSGWPYAAFKNTDGSFGVIVLNNTGAQNTVKITDATASKSFSYTLPAGAVASFKWTPGKSSIINTAPEQVTNLKESSNINVYPNPCPDGLISVSMNGFEENEAVNLLMTDYTGKVVYSSVVNVNQIGAKDFTVSNRFAPGLYLLSAESKGIRKYRKLVISK